MNRLQLVQRLHAEAAATGSSPTTTLSQTGEALRLVDWIDQAYEDIQNLHTEWDFLRHDFSFSLTVNDRDYTPTEAGYSELNAWSISDTGQDVTIYDSRADESFLIYEPWVQFRRVYLIGNNFSQTGRPYHFSVKPDKTIIFDLLPNDTYTVSGEYFKRYQAMAASNTAEPLIPTQYRMIIVWRALMFYAAYEGADEVYSHGNNEYGKLLAELELDQLPMPSFLHGPVA